MVSGQRLFPANEGGFGDGRSVQIVQQGGEVVDILLDGGRGALLLPQVQDIAADVTAVKPWRSGFMAVSPYYSDTAIVPVPRGCMRSCPGKENNLPQIEADFDTIRQAA